MFNAARRGSASVARTVRSLPVPRCMPPPFSPCVARLERGSGSSIAIRTLRSTAPHHYRGPAQAVEAEIQDEVNTQQSNSRVSGAAQHGPVTKFQELSDRNLVCNTLVQTITSHMGLETMTPVQSKTINETLKGIDVYAQIFLRDSPAITNNRD